MSIGAPTPHGIPGVSIEEFYSIKKHGSNVFRLSFSSHTGTHFDSPNHLFEDGIKALDYKMEDLIFNKPFLIEHELLDSQLVYRPSLVNYEKEISRCDFLLIRCGWCKIRKTDKERYQNKCPGLSREVADYLSKFKNIRAIGADMLSFAAPEHIEEGVEAHRILMRNLPRIQLYEDLDLDYDLSSLQQLISIPWIIDGSDSAPCTLLGFLK